MNDAPEQHDGSFHDDFPWSPARGAVVSVVRGFGAVQRMMEPYFARFGLTPQQFQMLTIINRLQKEPLPQRRLAGELYVSFPNVTVMLKRLESAGLVARRANEVDRREKFVRLTPCGQALLARVWKVHQEQLERVMVGLSTAERLTLAKLINKMIAGQPEPGNNQATGPKRRRRSSRTT